MGHLNTTATLPSRLQETYDRVALERARVNLIYDRYGQKRPMSRASGNQINFRRVNTLALATVPLVEGVTPTGSLMATTQVTATIQQFGDFMSYSDEVDLFNLDPILVEFAEILGQQGGETLDIITRDVLVAGTNVFYSNGAARNTLASLITVANIRLIVRALKRQNAKRFGNIISGTTKVGTLPVPMSFRAFVHPDTGTTLKAVAGWKNVWDYASDGQREPGEIGALDEVRFIESTHGKVWANAGAAVGGGYVSTGAVTNDVYATIIVGTNAYGVIPLNGDSLKTINKPLGSAGTADPLNQQGTVGWKAHKTAAILNDLWMARLEHCNLTTPT